MIIRDRSGHDLRSARTRPDDLTVNNVPARIRPNCGEAYADETVTASLLRQAEKMAKAGTKVDVREYALTGD